MNTRFATGTSVMNECKIRLKAVSLRRPLACGQSDDEGPQSLVGQNRKTGIQKVANSQLPICFENYYPALSSRIIMFVQDPSQKKRKSRASVG